MPSLPLDQATQGDPAHEGRRKLNGAFFIELERIRPDPNQPRKNLGTDAQRELAASIKEHGILQPIAVRYLREADIYQIISGERRYHASRAAGLAELPCWVQDPQEQKILVRQLIENWQRADLHPFEIADTLGRLRDTLGYTQRQLADLTGKSESEISKLLSLLDLAPDAQDLARSEAAASLSRRHLYAASRVPRAEQHALLKRIATDGLTAEDTDKIAAEKRRSATGARKRGAPVHRIRLTTSQATVLLTFRRKNVSDEDVRTALEEALAQTKPKPDISIVRPVYTKHSA